MVVAPEVSTYVDADDGVALCFPAKRKCTAKIVLEDDEKKVKQGVIRYDDGTEIRYTFDFDDDSDIDGGEEPPLYGDEEGELDVSDAALVEVDGPELKESDRSKFDYIVYLANQCRQKRYMKLFQHPGSWFHGLDFYTSGMLREEGRDLAVTALKEYQKVNQNAKMKLKDVMKNNYIGRYDVTYFITFSAEDETTTAIKTYQAAMFKSSDGHFLLALLRNIVDDEVLAILSVQGLYPCPTKMIVDADDHVADDDYDDKKGSKSKKGKSFYDEKEFPPLYSNEEGEFYISRAALVEVDGPKLKEIDRSKFDCIVHLANECRQKRCMKLFQHAGPWPRGLFPASCCMLREEGRDLAVTALKEYQKVNQNEKMKLKDVMKINYRDWCGVTYFITFSAETEKPTTVKTYQAALFKSSDGCFLLALLRDIVDDYVLSILSVKGTDEDLAADEDEFWSMWEERLAKKSKPW